MLRRVLLLLVLSGLIRPERASETDQDYHCDSRQKREEIGNLTEHFRRLVRHEDELYLVFKHRVIVGQLLSVDEQQLFGFHKASTLISHRWKEQAIQENVTVSISENDLQLFGQFYNEIKCENIEFFSNRQTGRLHEVARAVSFVNGTSRAKEVDTRTAIGLALPALQADQLFNLLQDNQTRYVDVLYSQHRRLLFSRQVGDSLQIQIIRKHQRNQFNASNFPNIRPFLSYIRSFDTGNSTENATLLQFVGFDRNTSRLKFAHYLVGFQENSTDLQLLTSYSGSVSLHELLGCPARLQENRELKGIYHHNETFFIFINRFYLKVAEEELLSTDEFRLNDSHYEENAHQLKFEPEGERVQFEHFNRRWVQTVGQRVYLRPYTKNYELIIDQSSGGDLMMKRTESGPIGWCFWQIFVVNETQYCLNETDYFLMNASGSSQEYVGTIDSVFENSSITLRDHRLQLIFGYRQDQVVFITQKLLFFFDYQNFHSSNNRLVYVQDSVRMPVRTVRNCLLTNCESLSSTKSSEIASTGQPDLINKQSKTSTAKAISSENFLVQTASEQTGSKSVATSPVNRSINPKVGLALFIGGLIILLLGLFYFSIDCCVRGKKETPVTDWKQLMKERKKSWAINLRRVPSRSERLPKKRVRPMMESELVEATSTKPKAETKLKVEENLKAVIKPKSEKSKKPVPKVSKSLSSLKKEAPKISSSLLSRIKTKIPKTPPPSLKSVKISGDKFKTAAMRVMAMPKRDTFTVIRPGKARSSESKRSVVSMDQSDSLESSVPSPFPPDASRTTGSEDRPSVTLLPASKQAKGSAISFKDPADSSSLLSYELVLLDSGTLVEPVPATLLLEEAEAIEVVLPEQDRTALLELNKEKSKSDSSEEKSKKAKKAALLELKKEKTRSDSSKRKSKKAKKADLPERKKEKTKSDSSKGKSKKAAPEQKKEKTKSDSSKGKAKKEKAKSDSSKGKAKKKFISS